MNPPYLTRVKRKNVAYTFYAVVVTTFLFINVNAQKTDSFLRIAGLPTDGLLLDKGWKYSIGDNPEWADITFIESTWENIDPTLPAIMLKKKLGTKICWLRFRFTTDSASAYPPLVLHIQQYAASEIFIDGLKAATYGILSNNPSEIDAYNPVRLPLTVPLNFAHDHLIAVRICMPSFVNSYVFPQLSNSFFKARISDWTKYGKETNNQLNSYGFLILKIGLFIFLFLLHVFLFFFYKKEKVNFYLSLVDLCNILFYVISGLIIFKPHDIQTGNFLKPTGSILFAISFLFLLIAYSIFFNPDYKKRRTFRILYLLFFLVSGIYFTPLNNKIASIANPQLFIYPVLVIAECLRISIRSLKKNDSRKISYMARLMIVCLVGVLSLVILNVTSEIDLGNFTFIFNLVLGLAILGFPLAVIMYIGLGFGQYYRKLVKAQALRNKIALDLHDDMGSKLTTVRMFLKNIQNLPDQNDQALLASSLKILENSMNDMRQIMSELQTSSLIENGYLKATEELINRINQLQSINFSLSSHGLVKRLEQKTEYNLFRITQELINNTLKYANAKTVSLDLITRDNRVVLMFEDDGKGFDSGSVNKGYGLKNIVSRAESLGGSTEFDTSPGNGFRSIIELPLIYV